MNALLQMSAANNLAQSGDGIVLIFVGRRVTWERTVPKDLAKTRYSILAIDMHAVKMSCNNYLQFTRDFSCRIFKEPSDFSCKVCCHS